MLALLPLLVTDFVATFCKITRCAKIDLVNMWLVSVEGWVYLISILSFNLSKISIFLECKNVSFFLVSNTTERFCLPFLGSRNSLCWWFQAVYFWIQWFWVNRWWNNSCISTINAGAWFHECCTHKATGNFCC